MLIRMSLLNGLDAEICRIYFLPFVHSFYLIILSLLCDKNLKTIIYEKI